MRADKDIILVEACRILKNLLDGKEKSQMIVMNDKIFLRAERKKVVGTKCGYMDTLDLSISRPSGQEEV